MALEVIKIPNLFFFTNTQMDRKIGTFSVPPKGFAYWRVVDPHKLYISGKVLENADPSGLDFCPTHLVGVGAKNRIFNLGDSPIKAGLTDVWLTIMPLSFIS